MMEDGLSSSIKQPSGNLVVVEHTVLVRKISDELTKQPTSLKSYISKRNEEDKNSSKNTYSIL